MKCPHCGKETDISSLDELKLHIQDLRDRAEKHENNLPEFGDKEKKSLCLKKRKKLRMKYEGWIDAIKALEDKQ
jgi:hypothetical protein